MTVENENGQAMRFYGRLVKSNEQVVIVTLRCESKPKHTKCILYKRLPPALQTEFTQIINSPACQRLKTQPLYEFLQSKTFSSVANKNVYSTLLDLSVVRDIPSEEVNIECPYDIYKTIDQAEEEMRLYTAQQNLTRSSQENAAKQAQEALDAATRQKLEAQTNRMDSLEAAQKLNAEQVNSLSLKVDEQKNTLEKMMEMMANIQKLVVSQNAGVPSSAAPAPLAPIPVSAKEEEWMNDLPPIQG